MNKILFNTPFITGDEIKYIKDVFKEDVYYGNSKYTKLCEDKISKILKEKYVLLTDSCTSALEIAALINKDKTKNEVIMPSYTFSSTAAAFIKANFNIKFADIEPETAMLDISSVKKKITKKTKVIVAVHYAGLPAKILELKKLCTQNNIILVEDAAQAFGSFYNKKALGTFGQIGCFSFHETKNIHAGLSGALVFKNKKDYKRAINIRERGTNRNDVVSGLANKYTWVEIGGSYYPTEINAAFLFAQLKKIKKNIYGRKTIYLKYYKELAKLKKQNLIHYSKLDQLLIPNYHAFFIIFNNHSVCDKLRKFLLKNDINAYIGYIPLHSSPVGIKLGNNKLDLPITNDISKRILRLPLHNRMTKKDASNVCMQISNFFKKSI